jgi:hypothetical protein
VSVDRCRGHGRGRTSSIHHRVACRRRPRAKPSASLSSGHGVMWGLLTISGYAPSHYSPGPPAAACRRERATPAGGPSRRPPALVDRLSAKARGRLADVTSGRLAARAWGGGPRPPAADEAPAACPSDRPGPGWRLASSGSVTTLTSSAWASPCSSGVIRRGSVILAPLATLPFAPPSIFWVMADDLDGPKAGMQPSCRRHGRSIGPLPCRCDPGRRHLTLVMRASSGGRGLQVPIASQDVNLQGSLCARNLPLGPRPQRLESSRRLGG